MSSTTSIGPIVLERGAHLSVQLRPGDERMEVSLQLDGVSEPCVLHWGVGQNGQRWVVPPRSAWPAGSRAAGGGAVETPFATSPDAQQPTLAITIPRTCTSLDFVLFFPENGRWDNNGGRDYCVALPSGGSGAAAGVDEDLARAIVEGETGRHSWTLMHRFNLCYDLLGRTPDGDVQGLSLLFVWLRFSAIRQLDWQRNYNTQPRELAHAQDRLTLRLAERFARAPADRPWLRLMLSTIGQGGEGQRVRDEVLNIMHRHHIKEVSGHFMEEWHQKLHNNTTPDDVVICEAYLAFLASDGNRGVFYRTLESGGVTRDRLRSYERPITSEPDFIPGLKDALWHDFDEFLRILKRLHSGTDLGAAIENARGLFDGDLAGTIDWIWQHRHEGAAPAETLAARITEARNALAARLVSLGEAGRVRALVYLDLGLEGLLRLAIERQLHLSGIDAAGTLIALALQNVELVMPDEELRACGRFWDRVRTAGGESLVWALRAEAATERIGRRVTVLLEAYQLALQPKAERLGRAFGADAWTISAFSEEVIRGRPAVLVPVLVRVLRRWLRERHHLPPWQLISAVPADGELQAASSLEAIQSEKFSRPTIVLAETITGQEEVPSGVTGILTPHDIDMLSHVAIRARNAHVLFASCQDADEFERLRGLAGRTVAIDIGPSGDLIVRTADASRARSAAPGARPRAPRPPEGETGRGAAATGQTRTAALSSREFTDTTVGAKARNLVRLETSLPGWIHVPRSVAIPFGAFERTLEDATNAELHRRYKELVLRLERLRAAETAAPGPILDEIRAAVAALHAPQALLETLGSRLEDIGVASPEHDRAWSCIKRVWASKWNERAFLSREANGIAHASVSMAVLVQPVVEAEYAFVVHTVNPSTSDIDDLYAEMVIGTGETLVGNHPGRAFAFSWSKPEANARLRSFPSKSCGLAGGQLIFRSDSNAEDLAGYAGAGLYDSVTLVPARASVLDYTDEPLVWDEAFGARLAATIAELGAAVERAMGGPQDVEGAYSRGEWWVVQSRPQVGLDGA